MKQGTNCKVARLRKGRRIEIHLNEYTGKDARAAGIVSWGREKHSERMRSHRGGGGVRLASPRCSSARVAAPQPQGETQGCVPSAPGVNLNCLVGADKPGGESRWAGT